MKKLIVFLASLYIAAAYGATTVPVQLLNSSGSTAGQVPVSTGPSSAPGWSNVSATSLGAQAANTVVANFTNVSASPIAFSMPSCSATSDALGYTPGTGVICNTSLNATSLLNSSWSAPSAIGNSTPNSGAFTTLSASSTVSGTGFSTYLASPPAIGGTVAAPGTFTTMTAGTAVISNSATSGSSVAVSSTSNTTNGASITLNGNGATTPNKSIRAFNGAFQVVNSASSAVIASVDDSGDLVLTGSITPSQTAGIAGTTTNNSANAGSVGEYISSSIASGAAVTLTTGTAANITSIPLTAGDWDVFGNICFTLGSGNATFSVLGSMSTTSATFVATQGFYLPGVPTGTTIECASVGTIRESVAAATTVFLVGEASWSSGSAAAYGFIGARRRR